ncbi:glycosyltransferase family 9 protein [Aeromonas diversa]|nr:glycosyltransferase family 9 protein [Aeromonas diversa]
MSMLRDKLRRFDSYRRRATRGWERRLLGWVARRNRIAQPNADVRRILVVRSTNRIGNAIFQLPFLHALRDRYPDATIELVQSSGLMTPFMAELAIDRIHLVNFRWGKIIGALRTLLSLRQTRFDLVYTPFPSSTDHLITALIRAADKRGFNEMNGDVIFDNGITPLADWHYAHTPLQLLGITTPPGYLEHAPRLWKEAMPAVQEEQAVRIGFFTGARDGKGLTHKQWQHLLARVRNHMPMAHLIHIQDPAQPEPNLGDEVVSLQSLEALARFTAGLHLFICADTGPLHLAAASGVRCLALYTQTTPRRYGCLGPDHCHQEVRDRDDIPLDPHWLAQQRASPLRQVS